MRNNLLAVLDQLTSSGYHITSVFDVGANKGDWTVRYEDWLPTAEFVLFEANPRRSKKPGKLKMRHKWINVVLSSPLKTHVEFYDRLGTGDSYYKEDTSFYDGIEPTTIATETLDGVMAKHKLPRPQLLKLDTQGSELDILEGAEETLKSVDIIQIEVPILAYNQGAPSFDDYVSCLTGKGYVPVGVDEIHISDNILMQLDVIFLKRHIKEEYYESQNFWRGLD